MKSIFLVNPISGRGHLDAYARLYVRALIELGYRVVLVADTDADVPGYLARAALGQQSFFSFISFSQAEASNVEQANSKAVGINARTNLSAARRAQLVWQEDGLIGILSRGAIATVRVARAFVPQSIRSSSINLGRGMFRRLSRYRVARALRSAFFPDTGRIPFQTMLQYVRGARIILNESAPDLVVFLYLDLMAEGPNNVAALDTVDVPPWSGILFHPRLAESPQAEIEGYFESQKSRGGIFLVPSAIDLYVKAAPRLKFVLAPDVADLELSAELPRIAQVIRSRATGRKIILQVGTIAPHKGIITLLDVIAAVDTERFFFALVGEVHWQSFGTDEKRLRAFYALPPENVYVYEGYLKEERDYNALITACDVIYAVYRDFKNSSNSLAKAAGLRRPILVARNSLMGTRVSGSGIGLVAAEEDVDEIVAALKSLAARSVDNFDFDGYMKEYSLEELKSVLADALKCWIGTH